jgi:hypothetical protein
VTLTNTHKQIENLIGSSSQKKNDIEWRDESRHGGLGKARKPAQIARQTGKRNAQERLGAVGERYKVSFTSESTFDRNLGSTAGCQGGWME